MELLVRIHNNLFVAACNAHALVKALGSRSGEFFIMPAQSEKKSKPSEISPRSDVARFHPCSLTEIYRFGVLVANIIKSHENSNIVFSVSSDMREQLDLIFLLGCHLIMHHGLDFEETCLALLPMKKVFPKYESESVELETAFRAVWCAKHSNWIDFETGWDSCQVSEESFICMDEYVHYARYEQMIMMNLCTK